MTPVIHSSSMLSLAIIVSSYHIHWCACSLLFVTNKRYFTIPFSLDILTFHRITFPCILIVHNILVDRPIRLSPSTWPLTFMRLLLMYPLQWFLYLFHNHYAHLLMIFMVRKLLAFNPLQQLYTFVTRIQQYYNKNSLHFIKASQLLSLQIKRYLRLLGYSPHLIIGKFSMGHSNMEVICKNSCMTYS